MMDNFFIVVFLFLISVTRADVLILTSSNETYALLSAPETASGPDDESVPFEEAEVRCNAIGSLVWPRDKEEQRFLRLKLGQILRSGNRHIWLASRFTQSLIRGKRLEITDAWYTDREAKSAAISALTVSSHESGPNWASDQPSCSAPYGECCAITMSVSKSGKWIAIPCREKAHIVCRVRRDIIESQVLQQQGTAPRTTLEDDTSALFRQMDQQIQVLKKEVASLKEEQRVERERVDKKFVSFGVDWNGSLRSFEHMMADTVAKTQKQVDRIQKQLQLEEEKK